MKKNITFFRLKRQGSTNILSVLNSFKKFELINDWFGASHLPLCKLKKETEEQKGKNFWINSVKLSTCRSPWSHQVSLFLLAYFKKDKDKKEIVYPCGNKNSFFYITDLIGMSPEEYNNLNAEEKEIIKIKMFQKSIKEPEHEMQNSGSSNKKLNLGGLRGNHWGIYTENDQPVVDTFIRLEDPERGFRDLSSKLEVSYDEILKSGAGNYIQISKGEKATGKGPTGAKPKRYDYRKYYDEECIDIIQKYRSKEISFHDYKFGD